MTDHFGYSHLDTSARQFASSALFYDPREDEDALPLITSGARTYRSILDAMAGAESGQPAERTTRWNAELTSAIPELSDWRFGTVSASGYSAIAIIHPASVAGEYDVLMAAWSLVIRRSIAPRQRKAVPLHHILTGPERHALLKHTPAPRLLSQAQVDQANRVRARSGGKAYTLEQLNAYVIRRWQRAQAEAKS